MAHLTTTVYLVFIILPIWFLVIAFWRYTPELGLFPQHKDFGWHNQP
jgi:hypothetical protein